MTNLNKNTKCIKTMINEKMRVLDDFGISDRHDAGMMAKLAKVIEDNPDKDPRLVLDYYCRPMIQQKVNSWN